MSEDKNKQNSNDSSIDLVELFDKLWDSRKKILTAVCIGGFIGLIIGFGTPRRYTVNMSLSPESGTSGGSNVSGVASMFGISNLGKSGEDALNISIFPEISSSTPFLLELYNIKVNTQDNPSKAITLADYLDTQKSAWWISIISAPFKAVGAVKSLFSKNANQSADKKIDSFRLTPEQSRKIATLRKSISVNIDKKSRITTVDVTLQDPVVTAIVADSVIHKLQEYIINYRISKAKDDCNYLEKLFNDRRTDYYKAQLAYANYRDANKNIILESVLSHQQRLQNEMDLSFQVYSQVATQLQMARAKVQEAKPVFAVVEPATIPLNPSGTGKSIVIIGFMFLAFIIECAWIIFFKDIVVALKKRK